MRSWEAVDSVRRLINRRWLAVALGGALCGSSASWAQTPVANGPAIGTATATGTSGTSGTKGAASGVLQPVLPSGRTELLLLQKRTEEQYLRSHDSQLLLTLGDVASALKQSWLAASLYVNHQRAQESVPDALAQRTASEVAKVEARAVRVFVVYQAQSGSPLTLRVDDRVVGSLPLDGWILLPEGAHTLSIEGAGTAKTFRPEPLLPGQAPRTIVLTDFGPPIVSTGVTVAIDGSVSVEGPSASALEQGLLAGIEANLVVALRPSSGLRHLRVPNPACHGTCGAVTASDSGASYVLEAKLTQSSATWQAQLAVRHREADQVAASSDWSCTSCDDATLRAQLQVKVRALLGEALGRQTVSVRIASEPSGAQVFVAGRSRGVTPLQTVLLEGSQRLRLAKEGYLPVDAEQQLTEQSLAAQKGLLHVALKVDPLAVSARRLAVAKWSLLGVGIASAAAGGALLWLDGRQSCDDSALISSGTCPQSLSTLPFASAGLAVGAAALVTVPILYVLERNTRKRMTQNLAP